MATKNKTKTSDPLDTPVMRQYLHLKDQVQDAVLFFRMGDFYELFLEDAKMAAPIMDVALTRRQNEIPMAGIPYHSSFIYLTRLLDAGKKVAIAEQKVDPDNPKLMSREIVRVITPGTLIEEGLLEGEDRNYLCALVFGSDEIGLALADISTGEFICQKTYLDSTVPVPKPDLLHPDDLKSHFLSLEKPLRNIIYKYNPSEILISSDWKNILKEGFEQYSIVTWMEPWKASAIEGERRLKAKFERDIRGLGFPENSQTVISACSLVLHYMDQVFPSQSTRISLPVFVNKDSDRMELDEHTIQNLDLIVNREENSKTRSLFGVMNVCKTASGKRLLKNDILSPMLDEKKILDRQDSISYFVTNHNLCSEIQEVLSNVFDIERIIVRMSASKQNPRDLQAIQSSIQSSRAIHILLKDVNQELITKLCFQNKELSDMEILFSQSLEDEMPVKIGKGPLIKSGIHEELDLARQARDNGGSLIADFESRQRDLTSINTLKVKYNRLAGYFIEVSRTQSNNVPDEYHSKQTLTSVTRFTCEELDLLQKTLLEAEEKIEKIEIEYFEKYCNLILSHASALASMINSLSKIDVIISLAWLARKKNWVKPEFQEKRGLDIVAGRHPVVESFLPSGEDFISNDTFLNGTDRQFAIITGPNMAGKSTYIRQIALLQLMAQMGSWVPAAEFRTTIVDRIFTRIGAHDNLTRGESTFYVEMLEASRILNQCTDRSLVIMDEVGRGTSTFDGISIAHAIVEYLSGESSRPLCFFATHYHELTSLEMRHGVFNLTVDVREINGRVLFLHKVREGAADKSYGIHVARLAGMPDWVINRAQNRLLELEENSKVNNQNDYSNSSRPAVKTTKKTSEAKTKKKTKQDIRQTSLFD